MKQIGLDLEIRLHKLEIINYQYTVQNRVIISNQKRMFMVADECDNVIN